jgi:polyhydroxyalkanoate synthesis regulator phasin
MGDKDYSAALLEEIRDQNKVILEYVGELPGIKNDIAELKDDVAVLKSDMKVVKAAITDISHQLADHEHRITRLEAA